MAAFKKIAKKTLKILGFSLGGILLLMFLLPYVIPTTVSRKIKILANEALDGEMEFSKARLSFFNHFPALTVSFYDFSLRGSAPFSQDTLITAKEVACGIHLMALLRSKVRINRFYVNNAKIKILVNEKGEANYNVYRSTDSSTSNEGDSSTASLKIEKIIISNSELWYNDQSIPLVIHAKDLNYSGKGDLSKAVFDLYSNINVRALDFSYDNVPYIISRKLNADLITKINTNSLALVFERNKLRINNLPLECKGWFEFISNGYKMEFKFNSRNAKMQELLSVLPPEYDRWAKNTKSRGEVNLDLNLSGDYIPSENKMPGVDFNFNVRNGYFSHAKAPSALDQLYINLESKLPSFNIDSLQLKIDSVHFILGKSYFDGHFHLKGLSQPYIKTNLRSELDLQALDAALGVEALDLKGLYSLQLKADGSYTSGQDSSKLRKSIVTKSIPSLEVKSSLRNGYFKMANLPEPIHNISFDLNASCIDQDPNNLNLSLNDFQAQAAGNHMKGHCKWNGKNENPIDVYFETQAHLSELRKFYPLDSLELKGDLNIQVNTKGKYDPGRNQFPVIDGRIELKNGSIQTKYYPRPIEEVELIAKAFNKDGTLADLAVLIESIRFKFEDQPFQITADLNNFENLNYGITSKGTIDLGKVYRVFSREEVDVTGFIETDLSLKGRQSDAISGRYDRLANSGKLELRNIQLKADYFPLPFFIDEGVFRFHHDKIWFHKFNAHYGGSHFTMDGALSNVVNYSLKENEPLVGTFNLKSKHLFADEFAAFAGEFAEDATADETATEETGVIMVPANLKIVFNADIDKTEFEGLTISDFKGHVILDSGKIKLQQTGFSIIDASVTMDAAYWHTTPTSAFFDFHLKADSFDVNKAYNQVQLFRDLAPSAKSVHGIIGIDYSLAGKLDGNMYPLLSSLKGGGVISVRKVKLKGFKLMNAVSKSTNKKEMKDPDVSKINIRSSIKNNILTLERTRMRIAGFRPRFEGQYSLDGKLNLKGRIGLPPFGIIGIPFTVKGTQDNPIVKLKRDKEGKPLEETSEEEKDADEEQ